MNANRLIEQICSKSPQLQIRDFEKVSEELSKVDAVDFVSQAFRATGSLQASDLMFGTITLWRKLDLVSWRSVIRKLQDSEVGLMHFIVFMGKYLGIDLREEVAKISHRKTRDYVLKYLSGDTTLFYFDPKFDGSALRRFDIDHNTLLFIGESQIAQGAKRAKVVKPTRLKI